MDTDLATIPREAPVFVVRPYAEGDADQIRHFGEARTTRYLCQQPVAEAGSLACPACGGAAGVTAPALLAVTGTGEVVAAAWLDHGDGAARAAVAVRAPHLHDAVMPTLIARLRKEAIARGVVRLNTCVIAEGASVLALFRDAGLQIESSLYSGGVTEVVLRTGLGS